MKPDEFWRSTPGELRNLIEGYKWREEREWERIAWLAANIMNAAGTLRRPVNAAKLLGRPMGDRKKKNISSLDRKQELDRIVAMFSYDGVKE